MQQRIDMFESSPIWLSCETKLSKHSFFSLLIFLFVSKIFTFVTQSYAFFFCCTAPVTSVMIVSAALGELILPLVVGQVSVRSTPLSHLTPTTTRVILVLNCSSCFSVGLRFHKSSLVNQQQQEIRRGNMWILVPRWGGKFFLSDNHAFSIILNINLFKTVGERRYRLRFFETAWKIIST